MTMGRAVSSEDVVPASVDASQTPQPSRAHGFVTPPEADGLPTNARGLRGMADRLAAAGGMLRV